MQEVIEKCWSIYFKILLGVVKTVSHRKPVLTSHSALSFEWFASIFEISGFKDHAKLIWNKVEAKIPDKID